MNATTNTFGLMATPLPANPLPYLVAQAPARKHPEHPVETIAREHPAHLPQCTVHHWCVQVGAHTDHMSEGHDVPSHDGEEPLLLAGLLHLPGSQPLVNIGGDNFGAAEARTKARQLHDLADAIDTMADTLQVTCRVEAMAGQLNALRDGASEQLTQFLDQATQTLRNIGDGQVLADRFLSAVDDTEQASVSGGAR